MTRRRSLGDLDIPGVGPRRNRDWEEAQRKQGIVVTYRGIPRELHDRIKEIAAEHGYKVIDVLFWVGCAGSFDNRGQSIARATAELFQIAGVDFAILGVEEMCCGETARRMGNEYLAQTLIEANIEKTKRREMVGRYFLKKSWRAPTIKMGIPKDHKGG